jgi:ribosomal 30S subunit maturation factor RimM
MMQLVMETTLGNVTNVLVTEKSRVLIVKAKGGNDVAAYFPVAAVQEK